jgi:hypothetical protein
MELYYNITTSWRNIKNTADNVLNYLKSHNLEMKVAAKEMILF